MVGLVTMAGWPMHGGRLSALDRITLLCGRTMTGCFARRCRPHACA